MKFFHSILISLFCLFSLSCGSSKLPISNFSELTDVSYLDGTYQNKTNKELLDNTYEKYKGNLSSMFDLPSDTIDSVNFKFNKKNMTLIFKNDSGLQEKNYKGKLKENYFEICIKKKIAPIPFIYFGWQMEKVRIGQNKNGNLLIHYWEDNLGWILIMASGSTHDYEYIFEKIEN